MKIRQTFFLLVLIIITTSLAQAAERPSIIMFNESSSSVDAVAFSDNDRYAIASSEGVVSVWDLATGIRIKKFGKYDISTQTIFSSNGQYALINNFYGIKLVNVSSEKSIRTFDRNPVYMAFSPNGRFAVIARDTISLLDVTTGKLVKTFAHEAHLDRINTMAFSPDGRFVVSGSRDYTLKLWEVSSGAEINSYEGHSSYVDAVCFTPNGKYILSGSSDYSLRQWDVDTGEEIRKFEKLRPDSICALSISSDGRYVVSADGYEKITLWDFDSGKAIGYVSTYPRGVCSVAFSSDNRFLLSGHKHEQVKLWDVSAIKAFGKMNWSEDNSKLWEKTRASQLILSMTSFKDNEWIIMTPEGYFNNSPKGTKHIKVRVGNNVYSINNFFERFYNPRLIIQKLKGMKTALVHDIRQGVALPPKVRIIDPKNQATFDTEHIEITVIAYDRGGGIDEIRLYHNDCAIGEKNRGITIKPLDQKKRKKTYAIKLIPGENIFRAVGFSRDRTESDPHEIVIKYSSKQKGGDLYLIVIGINEYKNEDLQLNFAVPDAVGIKNFFAQKWKGLFKQFHFIELYNQEVTRKNIADIVSQISAKEEDVALIYFAGHGTTIEDEWYFVTYDVVYPEREDHLKERAISSTKMAEMMMEIRALKKVLIIDACKSGGLLLAFSRGLESRKAVAQLARSTGTHVVAASTDKQIASEVSQIGHGVFTYVLLQGLDGKASNKDNIVTVRELTAYIESVLPQMSTQYRLKPQYPVIDSRGQDFPLVVNK